MLVVVGLVHFLCLNHLLLFKVDVTSHYIPKTLHDLIKLLFLRPSLVLFDVKLSHQGHFVRVGISLD
jgi:hypothetical protein